MRVMNFNPGPAALPLPVLEQARDELLDFAGTGMSIMEHSHRGRPYEAVHQEAMDLLRQLLDLPQSYDILFLQGGASQQFAQVPMNVLGPGRSAGYVITGAWSEKAYAEATAMVALTGGEVAVAASTAEPAGETTTYRRVPEPAEIRVPPGAAYVHLTSNETIHGVQFAAQPGATFPDLGGVPLVCDMSSDLLWRKIEVQDFAFIYGGAQKNLGPSGVLVVLARKDFIAGGRQDLPAIFQYRTHAGQRSLFNTPPTFAVYLMRHVLSWIRKSGGLQQIEQWNREKARLLYGVIDDHAAFYRCPVAQGSRSVMNVVFRLPDESLEARFIEEAERQGMIGLKGHRSVGGIRVSTYNAVPPAWVQALSAFMTDFVRRHG